jgi:hypothetical protein
MLTNKDVMRRSLFIETVKDENNCPHYTGMQSIAINTNNILPVKSPYQPYP